MWQYLGECTVDVLVERKIQSEQEALILMETQTVWLRKLSKRSQNFILMMSPNIGNRTSKYL